MLVRVCVVSASRRRSTLCNSVYSRANARVRRRPRNSPRPHNHPLASRAMASFIERHVRRARMVVQFDQALVDDEHPTPGARRREIATRDEN